METVTHVIPGKDYSLLLRFSTGETRLFDMRPYLDKGAFSALKDYSLFSQAFVALDTVCWPNNLDVAPETLYDRSVPAPSNTLLSIHEPSAAPYE